MLLMYKLYINLIDLHFDYAHAKIHTHTDILLKVVTPLPPPTTLRQAIVSSVAPKERATLSMEQVRPV